MVTVKILLVLLKKRELEVAKAFSPLPKGMKVEASPPVVKPVPPYLVATDVPFQRPEEIVPSVVMELAPVQVPPAMAARLALYPCTSELMANPRLVRASEAFTAPVPPYKIPMEEVATTNPLLAVKGPLMVPILNLVVEALVIVKLVIVPKVVMLLEPVQVDSWVFST